MCMISAIDSSKVYDAFSKHLDALEENTKTEALQGDMLEVAKKTYDKLVSLMEQEKGLNADFVDLLLNSIKGRFYSRVSNSIASDLQKWLRQPKPVGAEHPENYVWYNLCLRNR